MTETESAGNMATEPDRDELCACIAAIAQQQCRQSFARLYTYFAPRLKGFLMGQGLREAGAEELVQEVMLTVWRKAASYDSSVAAPGTWIFTIARNRRIDLARRHASRKVPDGQAEELEPAPETPPDLAFEQGQVAGRVSEALKKLPAEQSELIAAAYYQGMAHSEIAAKTGLPLGTVKSRIRLGMNRLRSELEPVAADMLD